MTSLYGRGHVFDASKPDTLPTWMKHLPPDELAVTAAAETARFAIASTCEICGDSLIATEIIPHALRHASNGRVRSAAGTVLLLLESHPDEAREAYELIGKFLPEVQP